MGKERFDGNRGFAYARKSDRKIKYQYFIFESLELAKQSEPDGYESVEVIFQNGRWVEVGKENQNG